MNGGSFSSTAIVCACLKREGRSVFIGEETSGNPHIISGDPVEFVLPQTKIKAEISATRIASPKDQTAGMGSCPIIQSIRRLPKSWQEKIQQKPWPLSSIRKVH